LWAEQVVFDLVVFNSLAAELFGAAVTTEIEIFIASEQNLDP